MLWVMTSFRGRISRQVYWLAILALYLIAPAIMLLVFPAGLDAETLLANGELPGSVQLISLASMIVQVIIGIKRLHDFNMSGILAIVYFLPLINFFATVLIGIIPGTPGPNRFGDHTDRIPPT